MRTHPEVTSLISKYPTPEDFIKIVNPSRQLDMTVDRRRAYFGNAPTISMVTMAFGFGTSESWMAAEIADLAEFSGCKGKLTTEQIKELSRLICTEYAFIKITEFYDFFRRFKLGNYGKFYGSVDPMVITCALQEYVFVERKQILKELLHEDEVAKLKSERDQWKIKYREHERMLRFWTWNTRAGLLGEIDIEEFKEIWWLFNLGYERHDNGYITP